MVPRTSAARALPWLVALADPLVVNVGEAAAIRGTNDRPRLTYGALRELCARTVRRLNLLGIGRGGGFVLGDRVFDGRVLGLGGLGLGGGGVDGVIVMRSGRIVDCPVEEVAVRMKSPVAWTVVFTEPVAGRSLPTPLMLTFAAPDVSHENVVSRGAQPVAGLAVKLAIVGAVEKAFRLTASGIAVPSLVWLSFRMAYG